MERRLLLLSLSVVCCLIGFSLKADEIYLSGAEKAMIALSLKGMQGNDFKQPNAFLQTLKFNLENQIDPQALPPIQIQVASFSEFLNLQKSDSVFAQKKLKQLSFLELKDKIVDPIYLSPTASVQKKINEYFRKKLAVQYGFLASTFRLIKENSGLFQNERTLSENIFQKLNTAVDDYTNSILKNSAADEVVLLTKLLKSYFKKLPSEQKAEIFYRLMQMPLDSTPTDLFLTMLQHAGPQMQKLVQLMGHSTSIPKEFQAIFQKLESQVQAVPWWEAKGVIEAEIDLDEFSYFEKKPIGVGTIAQTHRAQMIDGLGQKRSYAVGFRKPDIDHLLEMDHQVLLQVCTEVDADPEVKKMKLPSLKDRVEDIHASVIEELVMADKVNNQKAAVAIYESVSTIQYSQQKNELRIHVPEVSLLGKNKSLMLQELIFGKKPDSETKNYKELYPDLYQVVAEKVAELWIDQAFFKSGFFHADLHQGNMMMQVLDDHIQVNLLDFGMIGHLTPQLRDNILLMTLGLQMENPDVVTNAFAGLSRTPLSDKQKNTLSLLIQKHMQQLKTTPGADKTIRAWTTWVLDHGIDLHYEFIKLNRGLMAITRLLEASGSPLNIESLANLVALKNKKYVVSVVGRAKQIKYTDLVRVGIQLLTNKNDAAVIKCENLFTK